METVTSVLDFLGSLFTQIMAWFGTLLDTIISNPLLLVIVGIPIVYTVIRICVGVIHRFGVHS